MQRKKSRAELLSALYLNISEIAVLLDVPRPVARKIYVKSQAIDKEQLGDFWIYQNKVRIGSVARCQEQASRHWKDKLKMRQLWKSVPQ